MTNFNATVNPIIADKEMKQTGGDSELHYDKHSSEELFERWPGKGWVLVSNNDLRRRTGFEHADYKGFYSVSIKAGQVFEAGIYAQGYGPIAMPDAIPLAYIAIFCLWKKPEGRRLITDKRSESGGTWSFHRITTRVPTNIVMIGVSRTPPTRDAIGLPILVATEGGPAPLPLPPANTLHQIEMKPLLPGNHYFYAAIVADAFGNWDVVQEEFDTLRRQLTIEFPTIHVYNDGDPGSHGEGEFWFTVYKGNPLAPPGVLVQEFHLPTQDIDDWSETDRPYSVGFAHLGSPERVDDRDLYDVWVSSRATEHDGFLEADEGAGFVYRVLPLPAGRTIEAVANQTFLMDCPPSTTGDDFHYGVEVKWSVAYVP